MIWLDAGVPELVVDDGVSWEEEGAGRVTNESWLVPKQQDYAEVGMLECTIGWSWLWRVQEGRRGGGGWLSHGRSRRTQH